MNKLPEILQTTPLCQTRLFRIEQVDLRFSNGVEVRYERLLGGTRGAVLIVPMLDDDTVLLIREYAVGVERYELGLPKGRIEEGEDMLTAANREIMEETGYAARDLLHLSSLTMAPGYLGHQTHIILAGNLYTQQRQGDEPEPIEVIPWPLSRLDELLQQENFTEARSIAALFLTREHLRHATITR